MKEFFEEDWPNGSIWHRLMDWKLTCAHNTMFSHMTKSFSPMVFSILVSPPTDLLQSYTSCLHWQLPSNLSQLWLPTNLPALSGGKHHKESFSQLRGLLMPRVTQRLSWRHFSSLCLVSLLRISVISHKTVLSSSDLSLRDL